MRCFFCQKIALLFTDVLTSVKQSVIMTILLYFIANGVMTSGEKEQIKLFDKEKRPLTIVLCKETLMKVTQRRKEMAAYLMSQKKAVPGAYLSQLFEVSRQIIVQDIAALREMGYDIVPTHYGYVLKNSPLVERVFKLRHTKEQTEDELSCIVNNGGTVVDVFVLHKVYGKIDAPLHISTPAHVKQFIEGVRGGKSSELMNVTDGSHYHTVSADSEEILDKIAQALCQKGYVEA